MATYATDLADISTAEATTNFTAIGGGGAITAETDFFIQGSFCISKATSATWDSTSTPRGGVIYNSGSGKTIPSPGGFFAWIYWWGPGVLATEASDGAGLIIGSATTAYKNWAVRGSDSWQFGGWVCAVVDPGAGIAADFTAGTPTATLQYFGFEAYVAAATNIGKGNPYGLDVMRYGRGELQCTGTGASFDGAATWDNDSSRRWGLLTPRDGAYYQQGLFLMGTASASVTFSDSNRVIFIQNTKKVVATFNGFEERNASSSVTLSNISIQSLGTVSRGTFTISAGTFSGTSCTFTDMSTFSFNSSSTLTSCIFRRCDQITGGGASFNSCTFTNSTAAVSLVLTNLNQATSCTFESDGSNHAVNLGTISSTTSMNWNNTLSGYAVSNGSTGNEAILVNVAASQTLTINVGTGYSTPSVYNTGSGTVSVVSGQVTTSITAKSLSSGSNISGARVLVWATDASNKFYNASVTITGSGTTATVSHTGHGLATGDYVIISGVTNDDDYNGVFQITKINDNSYSYTADDTLTSPATGTIVAKWAIISGTTDVNGYIENVRSFSSAQPITGWVRKTSGSPYYQQGSVSGTINTASGFNTTVQLANDE